MEKTLPCRVASTAFQQEVAKLIVEPIEGHLSLRKRKSYTVGMIGVRDNAREVRQGKRVKQFERSRSGKDARPARRSDDPGDIANFPATLEK